MLQELNENIPRLEAQEKEEIKGASSALRQKNERAVKEALK